MSAGRPGSLSVLLPVLNGEAFLERVLAGLAQQRCSTPWEFLALDCGSTDRTLELLATYAERFPVPLRVHGIHRSEFNHGDTRNMLAALSSGEVCVFLTDDADPVGDDWLETIAAAFEDPRVWALYLRNTPRPEAELLAKSATAHDPGYAAGRTLTLLPSEDEFEALDPGERRDLFRYNDTSSAVRRGCWERFPYPRCDFGEDILLARGMLEGGGGVLYEDRAVIHHSHEYGPELTRSRAVEDAAFNIEWMGRLGVRHEADLEELLAGHLESDHAFLEGERPAGRRLAGGDGARGGAAAGLLRGSAGGLALDAALQPGRDAARGALPAAARARRGRRGARRGGGAHRGAGGGRLDGHRCAARRRAGSRAGGRGRRSWCWGIPMAGGGAARRRAAGGDPHALPGHARLGHRARHAQDRRVLLGARRSRAHRAPAARGTLGAGRDR